MKNIVIFGAPGSGKGTQSDLLIEKYGLGHISTGDVLRNEIKNGTELGKTAQSYIEKGALIPDDLMISILANVYDSFGKDHAGVIFDGFPRTIPQAEALDSMGVVIDRVIDIEVPDEKIAARMSGRRVCKSCGNSYHTEYKKPARDGVCDACGGELVRRKDDAPETVLERLNVYHTETEPLKEYYAGKGKLVIVEGQEDVSDTTALTLKALED